MRIPPYYRKPTWQQFFAGTVIGSIISWFIFLYIFGVWQEEYSKEIQLQKDRIAELTDEKKIWQEEFEKLNKKNQEKLTVQSVYIKFTNKDKYKDSLDPVSVLQMEDRIREDLRVMIAKDIETVYNSRELIRRTIENKIIKANDKRYKFKVKEMTIYTTLSIELEIEIE
ncbi:sporulation membrane protein YtrI [Niallia sp. Krafla_26]|uniref:sporulation membrane protein YtrI n=1 Tax=Niallia sp. Krafla_26 TaxID=3064703 RepID=UPI003D17324F